MSHALTRTLLAGSGAVLGLIGGFLMFSPKALLAMSDVFVASDPGLMSELTAPSGILLLVGAVMMTAAVEQRFVNLGLVAGAITYGSYGIGRLVSMTLHGVPSRSLITAMVIELSVATVLAFFRSPSPRLFLQATV